MRENKFRAWDGGRSEWRTGVALDEDGNQYTWQPLYDDRNNYCYRQLASNFLIISFYTGLKDKNGVEIYEGDIVKHLYRKKYRNLAVKEVSIYGLVFDNGYSIEFYAGLSQKDSLEVISNIYENKDLLK